MEQILDFVRGVYTPQNTAAAFSWTGDGWETIDPSTVQAFLDGLDKTQVETLTACYGGSGRWWVAAAETGGALRSFLHIQGSAQRRPP